MGDNARKTVWLLILVLIYIAVSFWVPYSKLWLIQDVMQNQARLFFANQSTEAVKKTLFDKATALNIMVNEDNITVQNINGEIIYIEMRWKEPTSFFFIKKELEFEPKIFGLIRGFGTDAAFKLDKNFSNISGLSDSTNLFLQNMTLQGQVRTFFSE